MKWYKLEDSVQAILKIQLPFWNCDDVNDKAIEMFDVLIV